MKERKAVEPVESGSSKASLTRTAFKAKHTSAPVEPGDPSGFTPEWIRTNDVHRVFGIRRGSLYGLAELGKVKGCLLRIRGQRLGVRIWSVDSIRAYITSQMQDGN